MQKESGDNLPSGFIELDQWSNECGERGENAVMIETVKLHVGTCTRSRVITYPLDSSSWINGAMHGEERRENAVIIETATLHLGTCTRNGVKTYQLNS